MNNKEPLIIYIMGVSGVGKSTLGSLLSEQFSMPYFDGDDFHSQENIIKMSKGVPLNDESRQGWLQQLNSLAKSEIKNNGCIIACSALKEKYRKTLQADLEQSVQWVFLNGSYKLIEERLQKRKGHYMSSALLQSQFDSLEIPHNALEIDVQLSPKEIVEKIVKEVLNG